MKRVKVLVPTGVSPTNSPVNGFVGCLAPDQTYDGTDGFRFTVDEDSATLQATQVLKELRRMARFGRMADKALKDLETQGFCDRLVPVAGIPSNDWGLHNETKKKVEVHFVRLPERLDFSRADLGPFDKLRMEVDIAKNTKYSGNPCLEVPLFLAGPMATQTVSGRAVYSIEESRRDVGFIRINKSGLSWITPRGMAQKVYKETKYSGAQESIKAFAAALSNIIVIKKFIVSSIPGQQLLVAAKTLKLQKHAAEWLIEDGHAERLFLEISNLTRMSEILSL